MMEIGTYLKYTRLQKNITQADLCVGICTPSYLSRIENNLILAEQEIYGLLFESLGLSYEGIIQDNNDLEQRLEKWYKNMFFFRETYENIPELKELCAMSNPNNSIKFALIYCRYLILNQQIEIAEKKINSFRKLNLPNEKNRNYFLYINLLMLFYYKTRKYSKAIQIGLKASEIDGFLSLGHDYEVGAFNYNLGLNYKNIFIYDKCKFYTEKALNIFINGYYLEQAIDCHILLGISLNNLGKWNDSLQAYQMVKRLLKYLHDKHHYTYMGMIEHNIGYCYQNINDYENAIKHYTSSLDFKENNSKLLTMINLIHCYYSLGYINETNDLLLRALELKNSESPITLKFQLDFISLILEESLNLEQLAELEKIFMEFVKYEILDMIILYGEKLASLFEEHHHYKSANRVYKTMSNIRNQQSVR
jgi:HTH-type transcriptional regulator, quorum sensing regulator NprR